LLVQPSGICIANARGRIGASDFYEARIRTGKDFYCGLLLVSSFYEVVALLFPSLHNLQPSLVLFLCQRAWFNNAARFESTPICLVNFGLSKCCVPFGKR
jgi:hypothetical protein